MKTQVYSFYKASEGGMGQKFALDLLRGAGIKAERWSSIYVAHTAVRVHGNARVQKRAEKLLFG